MSKTAATAAKVRDARRRKVKGGGVARATTIDDGEWTGAELAPVAGGARLRATPRLDRQASFAPARSGLAFAALASLAVHAAVVAAAALSLGAPRPTGEPEAIAVEWIAASGEAAAAPTDANLAETTRSPPPPDASAPAKAPADGAPPTPKAAEAAYVTAPSPPATPPQPPATDEVPAVAAAAPPARAAATPPEADFAVATDAAAEPAPAPPAQDPAASEAVAAAKPPPQTIATPPEADFAVATTPPRSEPKSPAAPPRAPARLKPASAATAARAASAAPAPTRGVAGLADYRSALLAKISGATRYPEAARERGATGVATVRFALDGVGAVTLADLAQSSGDRALDDEALAAVRRASPLPPPPAGAPRAYAAPIRFELR